MDQQLYCIDWLLFFLVASEGGVEAAKRKVVTSVVSVVVVAVVAEPGVVHGVVGVVPGEDVAGPVAVELVGVPARALRVQREVLAVGLLGRVGAWGGGGGGGQDQGGDQVELHSEEVGREDCGLEILQAAAVFVPATSWNFCQTGISQS